MKATFMGKLIQAAFENLPEVSQEIRQHLED
jgi:hypothetical protein